MKHDIRHRQTTILTAVLFAIGFCHTLAASIEEADVFDWWDNGIISQDEAEDILNLLEEGNTQEACALAEVYAQEVCADTEAPQPKKKTARKKSTGKSANKAANNGAELQPHGFVLWKTRIDSTGHRVSDRKELQVAFYRYTLRLGSQDLLTYRTQGYEAHFGDISTREFHSQIPMDTLMGTVALFPLGHFRLGGSLDTSLAKSAHTEFTYGKNSIATTYWNIGRENSVVFQASTDEASIAAWYQMHQAAPIVKAQIHSRETTKQARERQRDYTISWNTTAYFHDTQVPDYSRLSSTILKNKLWASQNIAIAGTGDFRTKFGTTASLFAPIDADTIRARFKMSAETGPNAFHTKFSVTCLDAAAHCTQDLLSAKTTSQHGTEKTFTFDASAKTKYSHESGERKHFGPPRLEAGIAYAEMPQNRFRMAVILPKGTPQEAITLRNESKISSNWLQCTLVVDFKQTRVTKMHPSRAHVQAKILF
ncbi:MAG: hypothetical protein J6U20_05150 [Fibrobacter sp.]|nr:hypothetical protein [Fibrobacter sp.]